jgi:hypothetical protein
MNKLNIKWTIDYDYGINSYLLIGDYNDIRYVRGVYEGLWGIPLIYAKWCITRNFKILNK